MVEDRQSDEKNHTDRQAPADQFLFNRQQRLNRRSVHFLANIHLRHDALRFDGAALASRSSTQLASGGVMPPKKSHEINSPTQTTNPNRLRR